MTVGKFKKRIFWFLVGSKLLVLACIWLFVKGSVSNSETWTAMAMVLPLFAAYISPLWKEVTSNITEEESPNEQENEKLKRQFVTVCYIAFPLYTFIILMVLTLFVTGGLFGGAGAVIGEEQPDRSGILAAILASVESAFGLYLGPVITALTQKQEKNPKEETRKEVGKLIEARKYAEALQRTGIEDPQFRDLLSAVTADETAETRILREIYKRLD
ncbi:MAG: hypothetical protein AAFW00_13190 [Bacteroidota bacterium]